VNEPARGRGVAGRMDADVRSDLQVTADLAEKGGLQLSVTSKVGSLYGDAIQSEVRRVARALGVQHARIEVEDAGAIDPVIGARVEAALRAAGVTGGDARPERTVPHGELDYVDSVHTGALRGLLRGTKKQNNETYSGVWGGAGGTPAAWVAQPRAPGSSPLTVPLLQLVEGPRPRT